jgi:hypothetical protein
MARETKVAIDAPDQLRPNPIRTVIVTGSNFAVRLRYHLTNAPQMIPRIELLGDDQRNNSHLLSSRHVPDRVHFFTALAYGCVDD